MKTNLTLVIAAAALVCVAPSVLGKERAPALNGGPVLTELLPADIGLSAPSVDAAQTLDVGVPSVYVPVEPCRIADTRQPGSINGMFGGGLPPSNLPPQTQGFWAWAGDEGYDDFGGNENGCGIPSTGTAIHVNLTVTSPTGDGYLRIWPNDTSQHTGDLGEPTATVFSWGPGFSVTNALTVPFCSDTTESNGADSCVDPLDSSETRDIWVKIYGQVQVNLVMDVLGYYLPLYLALPE